MAYSRDVFTGETRGRLQRESRERLERDQKETRERLERDQRETREKLERNWRERLERRVQDPSCKVQ